ncbi:MAG: hypothetical protein DRO40_07745 [Thermoprotei archaeon]|nr:MAG: hypothetical protein DRO40_07745 [Thermoprotei archaeon]
MIVDYLHSLLYLLIDLLNKFEVSDIIPSIIISSLIAWILDKRKISLETEIQAEKEHFNEIKKLAIEPLLEAWKNVRYAFLCENKRVKVKGVERFSQKLFEDLIENHYTELKTILNKYCRLESEYKKSKNDLMNILLKYSDECEKTIRKKLKQAYNLHQIAIDKQGLSGLFEYVIRIGASIEKVEKGLDKDRVFSIRDNECNIGIYAYTIASKIPKDHCEKVYSMIKPIILETISKIKSDKDISKILADKRKIEDEMEKTFKEFRDKLEVIRHKTRLRFRKRFLLIPRKCPYLK